MSNPTNDLLPVRIYALCDPMTGEVRYVGRTVQPLNWRRYEHIGTSSWKKTPKDAWVAELVAQGTPPTIQLLEEVEPDDWRAAEARWVDHFEALGAALLNTAKAGGGGTRSHLIDWTPEFDARLGVEADAVIAGDLGVSRKAVTYRREKLGIPASYNRERNTAPPNMGGWNKRELPEEAVALLGTMSDAALGQKFGFNKKQIMNARRQRGIASYAETTGQTGKYAKGHFPTRWLKNG